jgi:hypothetical protein
MAELPIHDHEHLPAALPATAPAGKALTPFEEAEEAFIKTLPPLIVASHRAFQRDLPRLLIEYPKHWVAYGGGSMIAGPDQSKTNLYHQCLQLGWQPGDFLLLAISPESGPFLSECDL